MAMDKRNMTVPSVGWMDPRDFKNPFFVHHGTHQKNEASRDEMENLTSAVMQATKRPVRQDADSRQPPFP